MIDQLAELEHLSRGIDYLGNLGAKLRDLRGLSTLTYELIQNADDATGASWMAFDVRDDALIVDNDGTFTDCAHPELQTCPWLTNELIAHRCDFHRFRLVASGDKRDESGTTGAFGIGFLSVYQISDNPQLISACRHWILQEDRAENERILVCRGCDICTDSALPRTRFIFPWAIDPNSPLRRNLRVEAISVETPGELLTELLSALPTAMIFLKKIGKISVRQIGKEIKRYERMVEGGSLIIACSGEPDRIWHLEKGKFEQKAEELKQRHSGHIEPKKCADVTIAIPDADLSTGVFCAFLPTQHETSLPFHINADFFPSNDRKGIILESDYQSEWNRAAITASADAFAAAFPRLPFLMGHKKFWAMIEAIHVTSLEAKAGTKERTLSRFWDLLQPRLQDSPIVYTTKSEWQKPSDVLLLLSEDEEEAIPVFEGLTLSLVHQDLRPHFVLLHSSDIKVRYPNVTDMARALQLAGLTKEIKPGALPDFLRLDENRKLLYRELAVLLDRVRKEDQKSALDALGRCAIAQAADGAFRPCRETFRASEETRALFHEILPSLHFLSRDQEQIPIFDRLCPQLTAASAVSLLATALKDDADQAKNRLTTTNVRKLLSWFEDRREEILKSPQSKQALIRLPIFPSSTGFKPLSELVLPGDFVDPMGLTDIVDLNQLEERKEFLRDLGAKELSFNRYVTDFIPKVFEDTNIAKEKKRALIALLATRLGEIRSDREILRNLSQIAIAECVDGQYRKPAETYFDAAIIRDVLGDDAPVALLLREHLEALKEFYLWVGVAERPRYEDTLRCIKTIADKSPDKNARIWIGVIFKYLGECSIESLEDEQTLLILKSLRWLPAQNCTDKWFRPSEIFAVFQSYLFESQADFLDIPVAVQQKCSKFMNWLGIPVEPSVGKIVSHLLHCVQSRIPVHRDIYRVLNDKAQHLSIESLKEKACIILDDDTYVRPDQVYWGEHPFGQYRHRLGTNLRRYSDLFSRLGVRETPDYDDARQVLNEIACQFGPENRPVDDGTHAVVLSCWKLLDGALDDHSGANEEFFAPLKSAKVIPNKKTLLVLPAHMFFEDRPGLAAIFGESLDAIVMLRPLEGWRAMVAAGVRFLSAAIDSELVECVDAVENEMLLERVRGRHQQITRVWAALNVKDGDISIDGVLDRMKFYAAQDLQIRFSLMAFNRPLLSQPEKVPAHFHLEDGILYFVLREGQIPWPVVAREVSLALFPRLEPGQIASSIKEILSAESAEAAESVLDELGFPRVQAPGLQPPPKEAVLDDIVDKRDSQHVSPLDTPAQAINKLIGPDAPEPSPPPPEINLPPDTILFKPSRSGKNQQGKLRTYVLPTDGTHKAEDPAINLKRQSVDRAGVNYVMEFERKHDRYPHEMPEKHPGYDLESKNADGEVLRFIEVKSLSGSWGSLGAGMSKPQFDKAADLGDRFWLYVVERAEQDDFKIHRIQDPARQVNQFLYDHGWQSLCEEDDESPVEECHTIINP
jgi:hypothetical protein